MDILLQSLFTIAIIFGPATLVLAYSIIRTRELDKKHSDSLAKANKQHEDNLDSLKVSLRYDIANYEKKLDEFVRSMAAGQSKHIELLTGDLDELEKNIDILFEREKLMLEEIKKSRKPAKKKLLNEVKARTLPSPKSMVFHLTKKTARRAK